MRACVCVCLCVYKYECAHVKIADIVRAHRHLTSFTLHVDPYRRRLHVAPYASVPVPYPSDSPPQVHTKRVYERYFSARLAKHKVRDNSTRTT